MVDKNEQLQEEQKNDVLEEALDNAKRQAEHNTDDKVKELTSTIQHLQADFENYRKRTEKERVELKSLFKKDFLKNMLPTLDMFDLALQHKSNHEEFLKGVEMIYAQFLGTLESEGVEEIKDTENFNPSKHEAVLTDDGEDGKILEVLQKGYTLNGEVIRCTRVKVGKQPKETQ